ncbi:methyltransferase domain-containing protein [Streptomyces sp. NPDC051940]|uniref:methyltransferase domain-containing protein n=1 Tax=Streptomyces sp. NPDC051940 TaxID=3155675 RepID=UPI00341FF96F
MTESLFAAGAEAWLGKLGALRDAVRQELVARQVAERLPRPSGLRVLDVGCGQATQALRLARAGHEVMGLEADPAMLRAAREAASGVAGLTLVEGDGRDLDALFPAGSFDAVLCHGVLMYVPEPDPFLASLVRVVRPGGLLSLLVRNADALALRPALAGDWATALAAFDSPTYHNRLGLDVRADRRADLTSTLTALGAEVRAWYGVRVFTDAVPDGTRPPSAAEFELLLQAEDRASRTDPYRGVAALTHVCAVRAGV